jgi:hypothetical protein
MFGVLNPRDGVVSYLATGARRVVAGSLPGVAAGGEAVEGVFDAKAEGKEGDA